MIHYRIFRNGDPPTVVNLWNNCFTARGAVYLPSSTFLEYFTLAKPYFDPAGLILAFADDQPVGFVHAGFGPGPHGATLDMETGIVCALGVLPSHQRQGIGSELLQRCEEYLRSRGAQRIHAGPSVPLNPFTFALYGGSQSCGFLASDTRAKPFFERHGYRPSPTHLVFQHSLDAPPIVGDGRFAAYRQRYEIHASPRHGLSRYEEAVLGPIEIHEYKLIERSANRVVACADLWEMETFGQRWDEHAVGVTALEVLPELRRQGLGKFLLAQLLRHLHEQFFTLLEMHAYASDPAIIGLLRGLGFEQVDEGFTYSREK